MPKASGPVLRKVTFRLPEDVCEVIERRAKAETRPLNSQIIEMLRESIRAWAEKQKERGDDASAT